MRDIERIDRVLSTLRQAWIDNPDLRLGQVVYNAAAKACDGAADPCPTVFYVEDEALRLALEADSG